MRNNKTVIVSLIGGEKKRQKTVIGLQGAYGRKHEATPSASVPVPQALIHLIP